MPAQGGRKGVKLRKQLLNIGADFQCCFTGFEKLNNRIKH